MKAYDTIFLDRDGTLNPDPGYIASLRDFTFFDFALPALQKLKDNRFCIVTNQSGVSRGIIEQNELNKIHHYVQTAFKDHGLDLLDIFVCNDHPDHATERRKPGTGMFFEAAKIYGIDLANSVMIGDGIADMEAAQSLIMDGILVRTGKGSESESHFIKSEFPIAVVDNLEKAVNWILSKDSK